jgi:outer membrane lipoprotein-sorting protein
VISEELAQRIKVRDMKLSRRGRWAVPAVAVVATGGIIAGSTITIAQAAPALPAKTPAQLLADMAANHKVPPLTGTVVETTSLGLPQLPQTGNATSLSSLLTGSHTVKVYWENARHFRLAIPQTLSETDLIRNGNTAWLWESTRNTVTKFSLPTDTGKHLKKAPVTPAAAPLTPQQAANQVLAVIGKTTTVSTRTNVTVAGEAAYQLVLAPKDSRSTIGSVRIAIDGKTGVPLQVQVFAKGATTPAFQVGYTNISYVAPAAANLTFTPPPGATVTTAGVDGGHAATGAAGTDKSGMGTYGSGWTAVAELPQSDLLPSGTAGGASPAQPSSSSGGNMLGGSTQEVLNAILGSAKPVSGAWGSGELLHTSLLNVLITRGEMYVGAVEPSVLYSAVGHATAG